ncbi:hypothetical protein P691DRAFT_805640 [Macrolepiota fuliginosa MF-IS2]|uniref:Uncharacterized protein n=1 Tax=Macrolepiota fuliginosa MF-IS2 TaxID=1400762 RepID=A0A9P5XKJ0_9AGAR|nr:hypothetical protein P691DRAFT_805640 [Macrolepiota fuliginosa MF-IS2]
MVISSRWAGTNETLTRRNRVLMNGRSHSGSAAERDRINKNADRRWSKHRRTSNRAFGSGMYNVRPRRSS